MSSIFTSVTSPTQQFSSQTSKPILPSTNSPSIIIKDKASSSPKSKNTNLSTISLIHNNENITFPVISCGQTINPKNPIGRPLPTKRGRKPLSKMPSTKKHIQNLTNQRAFRLRRENYVKDLEAKNATLEALYHDAKNEIKSLKERLSSLEKQFLKFGGVSNVETDFCGGVVGADGADFNVNNNTSPSNLNHDKTDNNSYCNVVETSDASNVFFTIEDDTHLYRNLENDNSNNNSCDSSFFITGNFYNNNKNNDKALPSCETASSASPSTPITPLQQITGIGSNNMFYGTREGNDIFFCKTVPDDLMTIIDEDNDGSDEVDDNENNNESYDGSHSTTTTTSSSSSPSQIEKYNMSRGSGNKIFFIPVISSPPSLHSPSTVRFNNIVKNDDDSNSVAYNMDLIPSSVDDPSITQWDLQNDYYPLHSSSVTTTSTSPSASASTSMNPFGQNYQLNYKWVMADTCRGKQNDSGET